MRLNRQTNLLGKFKKWIFIQSDPECDSYMILIIQSYYN